MTDAYPANSTGGASCARVCLARLDFGNRQTGTVVDTFWLDGPLEISAVEEARFAALLA
jgi:beta-lactamase class D